MSRTEEFTPTDVLMLVMTYPHPSQKYQEVICTAGLTRQGEWVRLYPIDYRYQPPARWFHKYQWINVGLAPHGDGNDKRKESRRPDLDSIRLIGEPVPAARKWAARRKLIDHLPHNTMLGLRAAYDRDGTSLGIVRPAQVLDMVVKPTREEDWKPEWRRLFEQRTLFGAPQKPLRKLPYTFHYVFRCDDTSPDGEPHTAMCEDWELGVLYLKEEERLGSAKEAAESVKHKFLTELCGPGKDTRFFVGTRFPYNTWLVLGVFYPPREAANLFG